VRESAFYKRKEKNSGVEVSYSVPVSLYSKLSLEVLIMKPILIIF
jgi:hypothetical protein